MLSWRAGTGGADIGRDLLKEVRLVSTRTGWGADRFAGSLPRRAVSGVGRMTLLRLALTGVRWCR